MSLLWRRLEQARQGSIDADMQKMMQITGTMACFVHVTMHHF